MAWNCGVAVSLTLPITPFQAFILPGTGDQREDMAYVKLDLPDMQ